MHLAPILCALGFAGCATGDGMMKKKMVNMSHVHMGRVATGWTDTPGKGGLPPTAIRETKIAIQHARFAVKIRSLRWMRVHTWHVAHAVNPKDAPKGPGLGYGVRRAAAGIACHIEAAAKSKCAGKNAKLRAVRVITSPRNVVARCARIIVLDKMAQKTRSAKLAHRYGHRSLVLANQF